MEILSASWKPDPDEHGDDALAAMRERAHGAGPGGAARQTFAVAGIEVVIRSHQEHGLAQLAGYYERYPSAGQAPDLILDIETVPGFATGRERGPGYPGFERQAMGHGRVRLSRFDARGEVDLGADPDAATGPVRACFQVGESPNTLEAALRIAMSMTLPRRGALLMHASAVVAPDGQGAIFAGVSGAGKSTISSMLASAVPGCVKISDELLIAAPAARGARSDHPSRWYVHATPFIGGHDLAHGTRAPVRGVYFLEQAPGHACLSMSRTMGLRELLRHVLVYVTEPATAAAVLDTAARLVAAIPCHRLRFARDPGVASVLGIT